MPRSAAGPIRGALRTMRKNPLPYLVAMLSLAAGIWVCTGAFTLLNALMYRDLPGVQEEERLVTLHLEVRDQPGERVPRWLFSLDGLELLEAQDRVFAEVAGDLHTHVAVDAGKGPETLFAAIVTHDSFRLPGAHPTRGTLFGPDDPENLLRDGVVITPGF